MAITISAFLVFLALCACVVPATASTHQVLNGEKLLGLTAASKLFPGYRDNAALNPSTLFRWITNGARSAAGTKIKLEAVRVGNRWLTSIEAINRFVEALTTDSVPSTDPQSTPRSPAARNKASEKAAAELDALGVK